MQKRKIMLPTAVIMGILAIALSIYAYSKGVHHKGLVNALKMGLNILPILLFAFIIIGMINSLDLRNNIQKIFGNDTGIAGISMASLAGMLTPGGTFVALSVGGALLKSGAGIGSVVAYIIAYSTWDLTRTPFEIGFLGWKFVLVKWCCILILPVVSGLTAKLLFSWVEF
jgi:uncharacterized membrane protein YraQ (UPF0718 family)